MTLFNIIYIITLRYGRMWTCADIYENHYENVIGGVFLDICRPGCCSNIALLRKILPRCMRKANISSLKPRLRSLILK